MEQSELLAECERALKLARRFVDDGKSRPEAAEALAAIDAALEDLAKQQSGELLGDSDSHRLKR